MNNTVVPQARENGQTLVEVLIALLVVVLVLTAVVAAIIVALRSAQFSRQKSRATFLGQEAIEWIRVKRQEQSWGDFSGLSTESGARYCLGSLTFSQPGSCSDADRIDETFMREAVLTIDNVLPIVTAEITVSWYQGGMPFTSQVAASFSQWEGGQ